MSQFVQTAFGQTAAAIAISSSSVANPSTITTSTAHGFSTGDTVVISGHTGSTPSINGQQTITVTDATHFTIPVNVTVGGTGGTVGLARVEVSLPNAGAGNVALITLHFNSSK